MDLLGINVFLETKTFSQFRFSIVCIGRHPFETKKIYRLITKYEKIITTQVWIHTTPSKHLWNLFTQRR